MIKTFYILTFLLVLMSCNTSDKNKVGTCWDKTYTNVDDAIKCLSQTNDSNGAKSDERLLLIAFMDKNLEANQKLGWEIIKDPDIVKEAKRKYTLVITDVNQYKIPTNDCASYMTDCIKNNSGKTFFVIVNKAQCWFGNWTNNDDKEGIINKLGVGNGP